jgi:transposase
MKKERKQYSAEFKVRLLREHLENQIPAGKICEENRIHPNMFNLWKRELFTGALKTFTRVGRNTNHEQEKLQKLEEKIKGKDSLISEIVEDNLRLKKKLSGEI